MKLKLLFVHMDEKLLQLVAQHYLDIDVLKISTEGF